MWDADAVRWTLLGTSEISWTQFCSFWGKVWEMVPLVPANEGEARNVLKQEFIDMTRSNMWIPTVICTIYVAFVFVAPRLVTKPVPGLTWLLSAWNLGLSIFSFFGAAHCVTALVLNCRQFGFYYTICRVPKTIDRQGTDMDLWVCFFVLSKVAELFDTVLKILLQKPFLFLHWYHHCMTCWLSWLAISLDFAPGLWYAAINFAVHGPMYLYFFLSSFLARDTFNKYCRPIAPIITTIQIVQMCSFVVVNSTVAYYKHVHEAGCHVRSLNLQVNFVVIASYLFMFVTLFVDKYLRNASASASARPKLD